MTATPTLTTPPAGVLRLTDIAPAAAWETALADRLVVRTAHPALPLVLWNYTAKAQARGLWTPVTRAARGLITHAGSGEVVARPMAKFFNLGEPQAPRVPGGAPVRVTDKVDGSLGIVYSTGDGGLAVATRGSFTSPQARHASAVWATRYAHIQPPAGTTVLVEIVFPAGRVVCDYGNLDDLVLLAVLDNRTGRSVDEQEWGWAWPGPRAAVLPASTFEQALALTDRPGEVEGVVVEVLATGERVKVKQEAYLARHWRFTGLSSQRLWEDTTVVRLLGEGCSVEVAAARMRVAPQRVARLAEVGPRWLDAVLADTPDEFHTWVLGQVSQFEDAAAQWVGRARRLLDEQVLAASPDRAGQAAAVDRVAGGDPAMKATLFALLDGQPTAHLAAHGSRPERPVTFWNRTG